MTAKDLLNEAHGVREIISANFDEIKELNNMIENVKYLQSITASHKVNSKEYEELIIKIENQKEFIFTENKKYESLLVNIRLMINKIDNENYKKLLTERYLNFKSFEKISNDIGYSMRNVYEIHNKAVAFFAKVNELHL